MGKPMALNLAKRILLKVFDVQSARFRGPGGCGCSGRPDALGATQGNLVLTMLPSGCTSKAFTSVSRG